jgi:hypothetical protein
MRGSDTPKRSGPNRVAEKLDRIQDMAGIIWGRGRNHLRMLTKAVYQGARREEARASCLRTGARFTPRRIRRGTLVNACEMVSGPCPLSAQYLLLQAKRRTLWYVEPLSEARTPLADFLSILLSDLLGCLISDPLCKHGDRIRGPFADMRTRPLFL